MQRWEGTDCISSLFCIRLYYYNTVNYIAELRIIFPGSFSIQINQEMKGYKMAYISLKNVSKFYQMGETRITANDKISFDINEGEFVSDTWAQWSRQIHRSEHPWRDG